MEYGEELNMIIRNSFFVLLSFIVMFPSQVFAWKTAENDRKGEQGTHQQLSQYAVNFSKLRPCVNSTDVNCDFLENSFGFTLGKSENLSWYKVKTAENWIKEGAKDEDQGGWFDTIIGNARFYNHFHNPLKIWQDAGLDDLNLGVDKSSLLWAQDSAYQNDSKWPDMTGGKDWSWQTIRTYYKDALTNTNKLLRQEYLAKTFKGLGHQIHLLQDKAVPAHVRNDAHILPTIENWAQKNQMILDCLFINHAFLTLKDKTKCEALEPDDPAWNSGDPVGWSIPTSVDITNYYPTIDFAVQDSSVDSAYANYNGYHLSPSSLFIDTDQYENIPLTDLSIGLAEYTNANFVSDDTIFTENYSVSHGKYFPYPRQESTNLPDLEAQNLLPKVLNAQDGTLDITFYLEKNSDGELVKHFLKPTYLTKIINSYDLFDIEYVYERSFYLDDECHEDYVKKLAPRAVGYSAALIDYFFRGDINIVNPYVKYGNGLDITGIYLQAKNTTSLITNPQIIEPFELGSIDLVYNYTLSGATEPIFNVVHDIRIINSASDLINSDYVELNVDFQSGEYVPADASDFSFMLVFHGRLGGEDGAVAAKRYSPLNNTRIAYTHQSGGAGNAANVYTVSPDGANIKQLTNSVSPDLYYYNAAWSSDGTSLSLVDSTGDIKITNLYSPLSYPDNVLDTIHIENINPIPPDPMGQYQVLSHSFSPDTSKLTAIVATDAPTTYFGALGIYDLASNPNTWNFIPDYTFWIDKEIIGNPPAWSPVQDTIAYYLRDQYNDVSGSREFEGDIFTVNSDGTGTVRLTDDDFINKDPSWSPDGELITFISDRDGGGFLDLWVMDKFGANKRKIYDCSTSCFSPTFSPDGLNIAFEQSGKIYTIDIFGGTPALAASPGNSTSMITWSPNLEAVELSATASTYEITVGESSIISWSSPNAFTVTIDNGIGEVNTDDSITVSPTSTTTYKITAEGVAGLTTTKEITITVN